MKDSIIVVGAGVRGLHFVKILTGTLKRTVSAIVEDNPHMDEILQFRLKEFRIPHTPAVRTLDEALALMPEGRTPVVFIMTPEWTHRPILRRALQANSHIFLEKPVASNRRDALEIRRLSRKSKRVIQVGFVLRFSKFYQEIKRVVDSGVLGRLVTIQMNERLTLEHGSRYQRNWRRKTLYSGGFLNEKSSHDLDIMCWLKEKQSRPSGVYSMGGRSFFPQRDTANRCPECRLSKCPWRFRGNQHLNTIDGRYPKSSTTPDMERCVFHSDSDVMDHQCVQVAFGDGTQGALHLVASSGLPGRDLVIHGTDGCLFGSLENGCFTVRTYWDGREKKVNLGGLDQHGGGDVGIVKSFLTNVAHNRKPEPGIEEGVQASLLAFAADQSAKTGKIVRFKT